MKGHGVQTPELCGDLLEIRVELKSAFFSPLSFFKQHSGSRSTAARSVGARRRPVWGAMRRPVWASCGGVFPGIKHAQSFKVRAVYGCTSKAQTVLNISLNTSSCRCVHAVQLGFINTQEDFKLLAVFTAVSSLSSLVTLVTLK